MLSFLGFCRENQGGRGEPRMLLLMIMSAVKLSSSQIDALTGSECTGIGHDRNIQTCGSFSGVRGPRKEHASWRHLCIIAIKTICWRCGAWYVSVEGSWQFRYFGAKITKRTSSVIERNIKLSCRMHRRSSQNISQGRHLAFLTHGLLAYIIIL